MDHGSICERLWRRWLPALVVAPGLLAGAARLAGQPIPAGKSECAFKLDGTPVEVFSFRPASFTAGPLLLVLHGMDRNATDYRDRAVALAEKYGMLAAAPLFDKERFPNDAYQRGNILKQGRPQPREEWTYGFIPKLEEAIRRREGRADMPCYLVGHSAGGQFLTRLAAFLPGDAVRIVAANPGSLLFPTRDAAFPYGFGGLPDELGNDGAIRRYLAVPLTLFLGTGDTDSKNLDVTAAAMQQGATRLERGRNCYKLAQDVSRRNGWPLRWRLVEAEGVGHDSAKMFAHSQAGVALFGDK